MMWDSPRDASQTSPGMPPGSLWLTLPTGTRGSSRGAAQGMDVGSLGRLLRSQPRQDQVAELPAGLPAGCLWEPVPSSWSCQDLLGSPLTLTCVLESGRVAGKAPPGKILVHHCHW